MKQTSRIASPATRTSANVAAPVATSSGQRNAAFIDARPTALAQMQLSEGVAQNPRVIAQRALSDDIHSSPYMVAQRAQMYTSGTVPSDAVSNNDGSVQRKQDTSANNSGLPSNLKHGIENLSGHSMNDVKVHYNSSKPAQLNAHAYAQGRDIHIAAGQEKHLPHEAWHVVQQKQGRVRPTMQLKGVVNINDDAGLEKEADVMGAKAAVQRAPQSLAHDVHQLSKADFVGTGTVQAIMSVDAFKAGTTGRVFGRGNISTIDTALNTYITGAGSAKLANSGILLGLLNTYIGGNHSASKIAHVRTLRTELVNERALLVALGAANGGLMNELVERAGGLTGTLVNLANRATPAHVAHLPALITEAGGAGGLANLYALIGAIGVVNTPYLAGVITSVGGFAHRAHVTNLATETGQANFPNIPNYLHLAGGIAHIALLIAVLGRNRGHPELASQLLAAANGNAASFTKMGNALPYFTQTAPPPTATVAALAVRAQYPLPTNLVGRFPHYNERHRAENFAFNTRNINLVDGQTIWPFPATSSANIQAFLETVLLDPLVTRGAPPGPPVPGAVANVPVGVGGMQVKIRIDAPTGGNNYAISQFFPENGTPGSIHFEALEMIGIGKILGHM